MNYKNGKDVLPTELLNEVQKYIQGDILYIPKSDEKRTPWGEKSGARKAIRKRNKEIIRLYKNGQEINQLTKIYNLSESSVKKIVYTCT